MSDPNLGYIVAAYAVAVAVVAAMIAAILLDRFFLQRDLDRIGRRIAKREAMEGRG